MVKLTCQECESENIEELDDDADAHDGANVRVTMYCFSCGAQTDQLMTRNEYYELTYEDGSPPERG